MAANVLDSSLADAFGVVVSAGFGRGGELAAGRVMARGERRAARRPVLMWKRS